MPLIMGILAQGVGAAPGAAGAYDLLETQVLTGTAASVTFTGLGSYTDYKHLQIRSVQRSTNAIDNISNVYLRFNSDTGSNYALHWLEGDGSSVSSAAFTSQIRIQIRRALPRDGATANSFGASVIDILDFADSNKYTTIRALGGVNTASNSNIALGSGLWMNTNAITSLELASSSSDFAIGSRFSLYGVRG